MTAEPGYRRIPLSAAEKARGEANFAPFVARMLVASGRFRVSADPPDQVELFQGVARRVSDMLGRPVVSYANGREIVITFGQPEAPALALGYRSSTPAPAASPSSATACCSRTMAPRSHEPPGSWCAHHGPFGKK